MVWKKLPKDVQKSIVAMIFFLGGASAACVCPPVVCDPPPPPSVTPSPMVYDPPPPPSATPTPMVCDPPPPPATAPPVTVAPGQHFTGRVTETSSDPQRSGPAILGAVLDQYGDPLSGMPVVVEGAGWEDRTVSDPEGKFFFTPPEAGTYTLFIAGDEANALELEIEQHDLVIVEWTETWEQSGAPLPLAEVRTVEIVWLDGLTFAAESPWPGARCRWSVSGGELIEDGEKVEWQPPTEPGRYLLQVAADWGRAGLAVDAVMLVVGDDGDVISS